MLQNVLRADGAACLLAMLVTSGLSPFILKGLIALKSRQTISKFIQEHAHKQGTPTMGGLIILLGVALTFCLIWTPQLGAYTVLAVGFAILGLLDDYLIPRLKPGSRGFHWMPKIVGQLAICIFAALSAGIQSPLMIGAFVFVILFYCNAYNFSDGLDGLAGGLGLIMAVGMIALSLVGGVPIDLSTQIVAVSLAMVAGFVPFLFLNATPAKVFMGDVGSMPLGAMLGLMWWRIGEHLIHRDPIYGSTAMIVFALVMFLEIVPVPIQVGWVKLFKRRAFSFKTPIHHAFQERGWPETRIVMLFHLVQIVCVLIALTVTWAAPFSTAN